MSRNPRSSSGPVVQGILETCLYAEDLDATAEFYERVVGLELMSRSEGLRMLFRTGPHVLLLFDPARSRRADRGVPAHGATGPGHIAFRVDEDQVDAWRDRLVRDGVPIEQEVDWGNGGRSIYVRDPAGNSVEFATVAVWGL